MPKQRERGPRTLIVLLRSLQGMVIAVELKNDVEITGVLDSIDEGMKYASTWFIFS